MDVELLAITPSAIEVYKCLTNEPIKNKGGRPRKYPPKPPKEDKLYIHFYRVPNNNNQYKFEYFSWDVSFSKDLVKKLNWNVHDIISLKISVTYGFYFRKQTDLAKINECLLRPKKRKNGDLRLFAQHHCLKLSLRISENYIDERGLSNILNCKKSFSFRNSFNLQQHDFTIKENEVYIHLPVLLSKMWGEKE